MNSSSCLYSIIIPHRNLPQLLQRCLDSIPSRLDVQIVVVDDNSDASLVDFQNFPGLNHPQVTLIFNKLGRGAGHARNLGMERALGKWLIFADCDDFFNTKILNEQMDACTDASADILFFKTRYVYSDNLKETPQEHWTNQLFDLVERTGDINYLKFRRNAPWGKFIRRELVERHHIRFQEVLWSNDVRFSIEVALAAREVQRVPVYLYSYTIRSGSLIDNASMESLLCRFDVAYAVEYKLKKRGYAKYGPGHLDFWWFKISIQKPLLGLKLMPKVLWVSGLFLFLRRLLSNCFHHRKK